MPDIVELDLTKDSFDSKEKRILLACLELLDENPVIELSTDIDDVFRRLSQEDRTYNPNPKLSRYIEHLAQGGSLSGKVAKQREHMITVDGQEYCVRLNRTLMKVSADGGSYEILEHLDEGNSQVLRGAGSFGKVKASLRYISKINGDIKIETKSRVVKIQNVLYENLQDKKELLDNNYKIERQRLKRKFETQYEKSAHDHEFKQQLRSAYQAEVQELKRKYQEKFEVFKQNQNARIKSELRDIYREDKISHDVHPDCEATIARMAISQHGELKIKTHTYMPDFGMSLEEYREQNAFSKLGKEQQILLITNLFKALAELKEKKIIHNDIKMQNIMIEPETLTVKIIDFGLANYADDAPQTYGTLEYDPPESFNNRILPNDKSAQMQYSADLYAMAMVVQGLCTQTIYNPQAKSYLASKSKIIAALRRSYNRVAQKPSIKDKSMQSMVDFLYKNNFFAKNPDLRPDVRRCSILLELSYSSKRLRKFFQNVGTGNLKNCLIHALKSYAATPAVPGGRFRLLAQRRHHSHAKAFSKEFIRKIEAKNYTYEDLMKVISDKLIEENVPLNPEGTIAQILSNYAGLMNVNFDVSALNSCINNPAPSNSER